MDIHLFSPVSIVSINSISALGSDSNLIWESYKNNKHYLSNKLTKQGEAIVASLTDSDKKQIEELKNSNKIYKSLDPCVLYSIFASQEAFRQSGWNRSDTIGVNLGSSRGATSLFEKHYSSFLKKHKAPTLSSPTTTLGNISSWVAQHLSTQGPNLSHSITCSTSLHSVLNASAWINSGMCDKFIVGGSEAPLTDFTIAQMQALGIYAKQLNQFPCRALDLDKNYNSMVLGEAAALACLEKGISNKALALITGVGYATEILQNNTSISSTAECLQKSMRMAMAHINIKDVDIIITHTPGTIKGDQAEMAAIDSIFSTHMPAITTNKWKLGHTLATSGLLSVELATLMIKHQNYIGVPYLKQQKLPSRIENILVNSVGFGGNAVSLLISKPKQ
jgi:3-oxoacyl-(acyl-carrier-protein) synthase